MSKENFEKFREIVFQNVDLQEELRRYVEREAFIKRVVELGAEKGFQFTAETVQEVLNENRRAWIQRWI
jgi:hypothetical protein